MTSTPCCFGAFRHAAFLAARPYFQSASTPHWNVSGIDHPAVDALVHAALLEATDTHGFDTAFRALDRVLLWNYYQIPIDAPEDTRIVYWDKFGRPEQPDEMYGEPLPDGWWFDEEKAGGLAWVNNDRFGRGSSGTGSRKEVPRRSPLRFTTGMLGHLNTQITR